MATSKDYIEFVEERLANLGVITHRKMFGEYLLYIDGRFVFTVCDNTVFVKKYKELTEIMSDGMVGYPYEGAKEHYIIDIEDDELCKKVIKIVLNVAK